MKPAFHVPQSKADADPRRWVAMFVLLIASFMNLIDVTIVNVALPSLERNLGADPSEMEWVIAAFVLAFITSLNDVSISVFLTGPGVSTLPIQILSYVEQFFDPTVAAVSVLLMVLTVAVMAAVERTLGLTTFTK